MLAVPQGQRNEGAAGKNQFYGRVGRNIAQSCECLRDESNEYLYGTCPPLTKPPDNLIAS